jgi:LTXXQ motif family protein
MAKNAGIVFGLLIAVVLGASSNAEARRWRFLNRYNFDQNAPSEQNRNSGLRASSFNPQAVGFGAIVEQLIRGCIQESTELKTWPLDLVAQTVSPDEGQRNALEQMRSVAAKAGDTLASSCPSDVPAALPARFDALEQGLGSFIEALDSVRPTVELFYNSLNDEQKARLVAMYMSNASSQKTPSQQDKSDQSLRSNRSVRASPDFPVTQQSPYASVGPTLCAPGPFARSKPVWFLRIVNAQNCTSCPLRCTALPVRWRHRARRKPRSLRLGRSTANANGSKPCGRQSISSARSLADSPTA